MKANWKAIGIAAVTAAVLYYPALKLYQYINKRRSAGNEDEDGAAHVMKAFSPAYRGKHKPHHRQNHGGHASPGHS